MHNKHDRENCTLLRSRNTDRKTHFVNCKELVKTRIKRYLYHKLREQFNTFYRLSSPCNYDSLLESCPLRLVVEFLGISCGIW